MSVAVLSIGSNIGDRLGHLRSVVERSGERLVTASGVYQTAPWGGIAQEPYLNAVLVLSWPAVDAAHPSCWLEFAQECERQADRTREVRWGPRTLDVDVISVYADDGDPTFRDDPALTLPHPRAHERAFVLAPWRDVEPQATLPQGSIVDLLDDLVRSGDPQQAIERTELVLT